MGLSCYVKGDYDYQKFSNKKYEGNEIHKEEKTDGLDKNTDEEGKSEKINNSNDNKISEKEKAKINKRMKMWEYMINNYDDFYKNKFNELKSRTRKGIPDKYRSLVWQKFAKVNEYYQENVYEKLKQIELDKVTEDAIMNDLDRVFPECDLFKEKLGKGQTALYNVLSNYCKYNTNIKYIQ